MLAGVKLNMCPSSKTFFREFHWIYQNINKEEQINRYTRGLGSHIWKKFCTKDYKEVSEANRAAKGVEAAHRGVRLCTESLKNGSINNDSKQQPVAMEIGNIQQRKLSQAERDECMKLEFCLRYR